MTGSIPPSHTHTCPRCGSLWSCYDPDCTAPIGLECPNCYPREETRR